MRLTGILIYRGLVAQRSEQGTHNPDAYCTVLCIAVHSVNPARRLRLVQCSVVYSAVKCVNGTTVPRLPHAAKKLTAETTNSLPRYLTHQPEEDHA